LGPSLKKGSMRVWLIWRSKKWGRICTIHKKRRDAKGVSHRTSLLGVKVGLNWCGNKERGEGNVLQNKEMAPDASQDNICVKRGEDYGGQA